MRKILLIIILLSIFKLADSMKFNPNAIYQINDVTITINSWDLLIRKIIFVESSNGVNLVGDGGNAIGPMQIWPIMVDEVNRLQNTTVYTYEDRWDMQKSIEMFNIYQKHYNPSKDHEVACSIWGCGPKGRFDTNNWYVDKVMNVDVNLIT